MGEYPWTKEIERANRRAKSRLARDPRVLPAHFDRKRGQIVVELSTGYELAFAPKRTQGLHQATPAELSAIEIRSSGYGLHFPKLDADLWLPALMKGLFGSDAWMAAQLGGRGGKARTPAKAAAARANGVLGGRPRKRKTRS
jgi:hypothetical protein